MTEKMVSSFRSRRKSRTKASVSREAVPLPMAMARTLCCCSRDSSTFGGSLRLTLGAVQVDDVVGKKLTGVVNHGELAAGAQAGVNSQHRNGSRRRRQQQVMQIVAKNLNRFGV